MSQKLLRKELIGKKVFTEAGTELGVLEDIVIDCTSGLIRYILIRFSGKISQNHRTDEQGRVICAVDEIMATNGKVVVI